MSEVVVATGIRTAQPSDLDAVEGLLAAAGLPVAGVEDQLEDGFVVLERDGAMVGVAGLEVYGAYGLLRSVAVAESLRGTGLGDAVVPLDPGSEEELDDRPDHDRLEEPVEQRRPPSASDGSNSTTLAHGQRLMRGSGGPAAPPPQPPG